MTTTTEPKVIYAYVYDPSAPSIFGKGKKSEPATLRTVSCSCDSCPLLEAGQCVMVRIMEKTCPYGRVRVEAGPTQRHSKFNQWIREHRELHTEAKRLLSSPPDKMAFIGDYVFLPYSHMTMCQAVEFLRHSHYITSGVDFIPRECWSIGTVLALIDFEPQAMFGGEITTYQKEVVPKFIDHIRECDPAMWTQLIVHRPQYDVKPNYVGRKALVTTLASPITIPPYDNRYPVAWEWNGKTLRTSDVSAYGSTWGHVRASSISLELTPASDASVVVASNDWVTDKTVFVD